MGTESGDCPRDLQTICLFDVDGTLSPSRKVASDEMKVRARKKKNEPDAFEMMSAQLSASGSPKANE